jgi:SSS family solute:Na+ symporter
MFQLSVIDYIVIASYFLFCIGIGIVFKRKAEKNGVESFVLSDRNLPWWLIGTSMVATTFSAETPLLVSGFVYSGGISKNWEWWALLPGAMLTTFLFSRLWRRTGVVTDAEYVTLRYSGREAHVLRAFRALYMGFIMNTLVLGSALVVSGRFGTTLLGVAETDPQYNLYRLGIAVICGAVALFYSASAGIAGIVVNDFVQFSLAMIGAILIAFFALAQPQVGGLSGLIDHLSTSNPNHLEFFPSGTSGVGLTLGAVALFLTVRWWSQVYGGAEPGGASHVAQRMLAARSEKDAFLGTLWFNFAHYALRPWPWILVGLAALISFPPSTDPVTGKAIMDGEKAYILSINLVPAGLKGLVLTGFFSALMAIDTRLNLGAAYFVNDFYRPYVVKGKSDEHYLKVSRIITVVQLLIALVMLMLVSSVKSVFFITTAIGSGAGAIYILRWYWWRVSAWSEIAGMTAGLINLAVFRFIIFPSEEAFNANGITVLIASTLVVPLVWLAVTFLTPATSNEQLKIFYRRVRPAGPGWKNIAAEVKAEGHNTNPGYHIGWMLAGWITGIVLVYSALFGIGKLLLGTPLQGITLLSVSIVSGFALHFIITKHMNFDEQLEIVTNNKEVKDLTADQIATGRATT